MQALQWLGRKLARYLSEPRENTHVTTSRPGQLAATLRKGDVLLVEGTSRFASAIRTITQSTWSHSALCIGDALAETHGPDTMLVEADINEGVRVIPLARYEALHTRICRPVGLDGRAIDALVAHALARIGQQYDLRNVFDLARYLLHPPPAPQRLRRRLFAFGGGAPTRAICSSLIADAFAAIDYPVLPDIEVVRRAGPDGEQQATEIMHIRHSRMYAPRDFDLSPYFRVVKPTIEQGFDPRTLAWAPAPDTAP